ncbi:MAG: cation:proton antiporter [Bacteroidales bacterium]|nr:cation:proton antiporter [Bacteroidales bacterium]
MMKKNNNIKVWLFYICVLSLFGAMIYFIVLKGGTFEHQIEKTRNLIVPGAPAYLGSSFELFIHSFMHNMAEPSAILLLQIISILIVSRLFGHFFAKIGQPTVIGEILAGIVLGPSLLGKFFPGTFNFLFAPDSLGNLYILSQVGLILFMFTIGMELNLRDLKGRLSETYVISHASIIFPFCLGMALAYFAYGEFAAGHTDFLSFALFIGISMSITAFPVLARIIQEKGQTKTHLGTLALASAAINDVTAWCMLAAIIAISKTGSLSGSLYTIGLAIIYVGVMIFAVRPFMKRIGEIYKNSEVVNKSIVAFIFLVLISSALATQLIGIHALFGAFLAGVVMPPLPNFRKLIIDKVEDVSVTFLLPLFFVFTGLRTEIGLLNTPYLWGICALFILVAILGKFGGSALTARILGESWRDSLSLGILMNTRGLMELIVLNIGYEMGILPPTIFVMLVIMALVTTFMTTPLMSLIYKLFPARNIHEELKEQQAFGIFKALVACGNPENGRPLLHVAKTVLDGSQNSLAVTVLHITVGTDINPIHGEEFSTESFKVMREVADSLNIPIETEYKVTDNIGHEIVHNVNVNNYDFLLVGAGVNLPGKSFFRKNFFYPGSLIKDKTRYFIENSKCSVGIFVNRNFSKISRTLVLLDDEHDEFLLRYARRLLHNNSEVSIRILDVNNLIATNESIGRFVGELKEEFPNYIKISKHTHLTPPYISGFSFMLISYKTWNKFTVSGNKVLESIPSTLIINKKSSRFHIQDIKNKK